MTRESEFERLENFVNTLLESYRELKEENSRLIQEIQFRDETIVNLREQVAAGDVERGEISNRVDRIIGQIEQWENELGLESRAKSAPQSDASRQGSLFSVEVDARDEGEKA